MPISILFVCLGNICRSPMAEGAFRAVADERGVEHEADSAGTGRWHVGQPPDSRAVAVAAANGVDISEQVARVITVYDFRRFDHIVALDRSVLTELESKQPDDASAQLSLLLDHVEGREGEDVADPYYGEESGFATTWADVTAGAEGLLSKFAET